MKICDTVRRQTHHRACEQKINQTDIQEHRAFKTLSAAGEEKVRIFDFIYPQY